MPTFNNQTQHRSFRRIPQAGSSLQTASSDANSRDIVFLPTVLWWSTLSNTNFSKTRGGTFQKITDKILQTAYA